MTIAIEPKTKADLENLERALAKLAAEDPSFRVSTDHESGQTILEGTSELHLDVKVDILKRAHRIDVNIGAPQVAFRETLTRPVDVDYTHKAVHGPKGDFARVKLHFEPMEFGKGFQFVPTVVGGSFPEEYLPGIRKGLESVLGAGMVAGFPVVDIKVELIDGAHHEVDSSPNAFETASRAAFREALQRGGAVLIEPIMKVEVLTPKDCVGSVIRDLVSRHGQIHGQDTRGDASRVTATVSLMNLFGYINTLRFLTGGRATYSMSYSHYAPVAPRIDPEPPPAAAAALRL